MYYWKRLVWAFQPSKGYDSLIKNCHSGSAGILWLMVAVSCAIYAISSSMVENKLMKPVYKAAQDIPLFSIKDGQLSMPTTTRRYVKQTSTWMLVLDPTGKTTMNQLPWYRHIVLLTDDCVYIKPMTLTPLNVPDTSPMRWMDGATTRNFADKLRSSVHSFTMEQNLWSIITVMLSRVILAALLGGILSIIHVKGKHRAFNQSWLISTHAQIPAVVVDLLVVMTAAIMFDVGQPGRLSTPLEWPWFYIITIIVSIWAHFKTHPDVVPS